MSSQAIEDQLRVLVVDDEPALNSVFARYLTRHGYRVQVAEDGQHALEMFRPGAYDAVISDILMPRMDGWQLAAALQGIAPGLPILLMTGYSTGGGTWSQDALEQQGVVTLLDKPFELRFLLGFLEDVKRRKKGGRK